jgi:hypothetical protein
MRKFLPAFTLAVLSACGACAADNPFAGTWKLDPAKSNYAGVTLTYTKLDNGSYHFSGDDGPGFDIGFEGKEYPVGGGYTISQTMDGDFGWNSTWKLNGKVTSNDRGQISPDNKTLTLTQNRVRPDGSVGTTVTTLTRVSGKTGPAGSWKMVKTNTEVYSLVVSSPSDGVMRWEVPENKQLIEGKVDGSDLPVAGPLVAPGTTEALTRISPTKISYSDKEGGNPVQMGVRTVSSDGKILTDESWSPGKESEKSTEVFVKQ